MVKLDTRKLLGFRVAVVTTGSKTGIKLGLKAGIKAGTKY
jgi:hypothetical protein